MKTAGLWLAAAWLVMASCISSPLAVEASDDEPDVSVPEQDPICPSTPLIYCDPYKGWHPDAP